MNSRAGMRFYALPIIGFLLMALCRVTQAQNHIDMSSPSSAPLPPPSSDGAAIDQGIAYTLLMLALLVTYLVH